MDYCPACDTAFRIGPIIGEAQAVIYTATADNLARVAVFSIDGDGDLSRSTGDLYVADYENSRIRLISGKTGIVTTVAGSGACTPGPPPFSGASVCKGGFAGDGGLATSAALNYASAVVLDGQGNLYIADTLNHRIRLVVAATGIIYTIAGNGTNGFGGDGGPATAAEIGLPASIAVDALGRVFFSDENNQRIRMLTPARPQFFGGRQRRPPGSFPVRP